MIIKKAHCLFEQSGTFKNEFIKIGIPAFDYDIQNEFGETDYVIDLFQEIEKAYEEKESIFDNFSQEDIVLAFFPCIYFCEASQMAMSWSNINYRKLSCKETSDKIILRAEERMKFYVLAIKLLTIAKIRGLKLIMENPATKPHYLNNNFVSPPMLVDKDRTIRGDFYKKPTQYWFINCYPGKGKTIQQDKQVKTIRNSRQGLNAGVCSAERSMISSDYARNFIYDFLLEKMQDIGQLQLFSPSSY